MGKNVLLEDFDSEYGSIPFSKIKNCDYKEAIINGIKKGRNEIERIAKNIEYPTFENTIVALERSGKDLERVLNVFYPLLSAASNEEMMQLSLDIIPLLNEYSSEILLNKDLWLRIKKVYDDSKIGSLEGEDFMLLKKKYEYFRLNGALLDDKAKERLKNINAEISKRTTLFAQNVLNELKTIQIYVSPEKLNGLPNRVLEGLKIAAANNGREGECLITLDQPTYTAILKYVESRSLREKLWRIYNSRNLKGEYSNREMTKEIANLRLEKAQLLGFETYADMKLEFTMAKNKERVLSFLNELRGRYQEKCEIELKELSEYASLKEGKTIILHPWDYSYYFNKRQNDLFSYDEEATRPYFPLDNVISGLFQFAEILYDLKFETSEYIEGYEEGVKVYKVSDKSDNYLGLFYMDFFPRPNKRSGAWMTNFREQYKDNEENVRPIVSVVTNLTKPNSECPSLLSLSEVRTLLHEFGHALHGLLAQTKYASLSGTNVARDFVELPSQFNENFLNERCFINIIGKHYLTGEPIPIELTDIFEKIEKDGVGYACMRQLQFGFLDMGWHTQRQPIIKDTVEFEKEIISNISPFPIEPETSISTQFNHIFSGGYASGYYSYKWAEVLEADAFAVFKEAGVFDKKTAQKFRKEILEKGGSVEPDILYRNFRGRDPEIKALTDRDGLIF